MVSEKRIINTKVIVILGWSDPIYTTRVGNWFIVYRLLFFFINIDLKLNNRNKGSVEEIFCTKTSTTLLF